jgi:hypothetical protein
MIDWTFDDPRGSMDVIGELFPNASIGGLALLDALRKIDRSARRIAHNSKRYSEARMDKRLGELKGYLRGILGTADYERLGVEIWPRIKSGTIMIPQENMPEKDGIWFAEFIDRDYNQWFLLV